MTAPVTQAAIVQGLARLGITPTCHLMVHASLSKFGYVEGGAETVVAALRQATGKAGALIAPSFRNAIREDYYPLRECEHACPQPLCTSTERGHTGKIGETVREQPDALRSCHPAFSWVGVGDDARFLLEGHGHSPTPCGHDSPFFRLLQRGGIVLLLGVGVNSFTNFHAIEDVRNVPYLSAVDPAHRHSPYTVGARRIQYKYPDLLHAALDDAGMIRSTQIGRSTCLTMRARRVASFLWMASADDPWCMALRPGRAGYEPEADAVTKTARMLEVWQNDPDTNAWQQFLEASRRPVNPVAFIPADAPATGCPAYRGVLRGYHRCAANDIPPWESFDTFGADDPGVATCQQCNWPQLTEASGQ